ncbi:nicotinate-nucleotide adenylyltransferase [Christiangramia salexigens]|uniref:Nicotinate-nucleotide adenylyltransferase n=1 Tax=Christiangramia salexigens TaxID=1913577 RepID=A0A1L3J7E6_9FLAO|nr:nicotinate-nucleotide adenylyltransferase [Christiangramia salexigens]APG61040.1 nicotinate-nucleotide adenylyltransferase [Christiangramia salexigens]
MTDLNEVDEFQSIISIENKCNRLNRNENIYGTFAEIGAGQETVRHFFRAHNPKGTIAKTLSAYDKDFSDAIYGLEPQNRYVTEARLKSMLDYETGLIEQRISRIKHPNKLFFSYGNTVATIDWAKKYKGHGWMGVKFQKEPKQAYSEIILHVQFHENNASHQQLSLGIMGANLIYAAFYQSEDPKKLISHLYDHLTTDKIEIDSINFSGPVFEGVDNRLMSLQLVKEGITEAVMFSPEGNNVLAANILYKKNILTLRGSFRPVTNLHMNIYEKSLELFLKEKDVKKKNTIVIFEMTLSNLKTEGEIEERDFLDRADLLCSLGHTVMISNFQEYYKVVEYFALHTKEELGLAMGVDSLIDIFNEKYYRHLSGGILEAFGKLFFKSLKVYLFPFKDPETGKIITSKNLKVHPRVKELYKFFLDNDKVIDIQNYDPDLLDTPPKKAYDLIMDGDSHWESLVPAKPAKMIRENNMFRKNKNR